MQYFFHDKNIHTKQLEPNKTSRKIRAYDKEIMMVEVMFENDAIGYMHKHMHEQATYCLEGRFSFTVGDETQEIGVGDTVYMPPDVMHGCQLLSEKGRLLDVFTPMREDFLE